jgi:beta-glucanase (GH16 family)
VVGLGGRPSAKMAAARKRLASVLRLCRPHVGLVVVIALIAQGASSTTGERDANRREPADVESAGQELGRRDLAGPSNWRRRSAAMAPVGRPASRSLSSWVTRISAGPSAFIDAAGHQWRSDTGHLGGRSAVTSAPIEGTSSPTIYQHERWGMRAYTLPVPGSGTYAITLYLAETKYSRPGERVFDVSAEGVVRASDVDIIKAVGRNHAHHVIFTSAVTDGQLDLGFASKADHAKVNGIEVAFLRASTAARRLVWSDEFDGSRHAPVDRRRWRHEIGGAWGDGELQSYTARTTNSYQDGRGQLVLAVRAERYTGGDSITRNYTSARISTKEKYSFQYGMFQARMQTPTGKGLWPAFWALGTDIDRTDWPGCGEIDVMEQVGQEPTKTYGTIHGPRNVGGGQKDYEPGRFVVHTSPLSQGFHTYGVQWLPGSMQFYFDGHAYWSITAADLPTGSRWVFDHPFYLILNVAVGGQWAGTPDVDTKFPQTLRVDHVRIYQ